jgi:hypothetical protein
MLTLALSIRALVAQKDDEVDGTLRQEKTSPLTFNRFRDGNNSVMELKQ